MANNYSKISNYKIIDVSIWMDAFIFPDNPAWELEGPLNRVRGSNPEYVYDFKLCSQSGTHIQGPHYFKEDGARINEFQLSCFEGTAYLIDLVKRGVDTEKDELAYLLKDIDLTDGILILRTGHMDELIRDKQFDQATRPGISIEAAEFLCEEKGVRMIAIDSVGLESRTSKNYEVNTYLCSKGILILECLANLYSIQSRKVHLEAFPLKIDGVEGTPCRAIIKEEI